MSRKPLSGIDTARVLWRRFEIERERQLSGLTRELSRDEVEAAAMAEAQNSEPAQTVQAERATLPQGEAAAVPQEGQEKPKPAKPEPRQTEINRWLRDTWEAEGRPGGAAFFRKLKAYKGKPGSPIREWWQAGERAGIEYETSAGARKEWTVKTLQNKISKWKQTAAPDKP